MHMVKKKKTNPTTLEEANEQVKFPCDVCGKGFPTIKGVSSHKRYCRGIVEAELANSRSRKYQKIDNIIKLNKLKALVEAEEKVMYNGSPLNNVNILEDLGAQLVGSGGEEVEVEHRISNAIGMFRSHSAIWRDRKLPLQLEVRFFIVRILSILLYGCESWTMTTKIMRNVRGLTARYFARMVNKQNLRWI
jgi:hypothetical protein